jgi:hypothetical protein
VRGVFEQTHKKEENWKRKTSTAERERETRGNRVVDIYTRIKLKGKKKKKKKTNKK